MTSKLTPKQAGFHMPAEWAPHLRTWMMWPSRAEVWQDMAETRRNYAAVAHAIAEFEPVSMLVRSADRAEAANILGADIDLIDAPINDSWARDAGPCFLVDGRRNRAGVSFRFNAWGGKYAPYDGDDAASDVMIEAAGVRPFASSLVAEGGGVSVDGEGTILTTESCFPNANRNPEWSRQQIEDELKAMLGGDTVIWLPGNVEETETDGHVDGVAVFAAPGVVLIEAEGPSDCAWHAINAANIAAFDGQTDAKGRAPKLVHVPEAADAEGHGDKFCRSYVNSYVVNGAVIMPRYGIGTDDLVREMFEDVFPGRRIIQVPIPHIAIGGGGIHCITQQEPAP